MSSIMSRFASHFVSQTRIEGTTRKIPGTTIRSGKYHLNLRIPAEPAAQYPAGQTHIRRSLRLQTH